MMPNHTLRRGFRSLAACLLAIFSLLAGTSATAQYIPGQIVRKSTNATSDAYLNPNGDNFVSKTPAGYTGDDDVSSTTNELPYKPVYPFYSEPNSDLRRGPDKRFTDFVPSTIDKASYYMYYDNVNSRLLLRVRMGAIIPGAKGFTFLFDTDGKFGASGPYADPNYKAATTGIGGNPGFEVELDLYTQNAASSQGIAVYNIDGQDKRQNFTQLYSVNNWVDYSQIAMAATTDAGDPDYYIDFWLPFSALGITTSTPLRIIPTTMMAPLPAIGGPKSDIYGLPDGYYGDYMAEYVNMVVGTPSYTITQFQSGGTGMTSTQACTAPASLNKVASRAATSTQTISGTWTPLNLFTDATGVTKASLTAKVSLYKVGTPAALTSSFVTTTTNTPVTFSFSNVTVTTGDRFFVRTQGYTAANGTANESECYSSDTLTAAVQCNPANRPVVTATGSTTGFSVNCVTTSKGAAGNKPSGMAANAGAGNPSSIVYVTYTSAASPLSDNQSANLGNIATQKFGTGNGSTVNTAVTEVATGTGTNYTWSYSNGCSAGPGIQDGNYKFYLIDNNNCQSDPLYVCVGNGGNTIKNLLSVPVITTTGITATTTSISGTSNPGVTITLYINGVAQTPVTASGTFSTATTNATWTVSGLTLSYADQIIVSADYWSGTMSTSQCGKVSATSSVGCSVDAPVPATDVNTGWLTQSSGTVSGSAALAGATVTMYNASNSSIGTATVSTSGTWTITPSPALVSGQTYTFKLTSATCNSPLSGSYTYTSTTPTASCANAYITSFKTTSPFVTSPVVNGGTGSLAVDPFATEVTVTLAADGSNGRMVTLYETNGSNTTNLTAIASVYIAPGGTSAVFAPSAGSGNLGLYTNSSTPNLLIGFANYNSGTSTYTSLETICSSNVIGTVPCPVNSLSQPSLSVVTTCPTCTAGLGTSNVTLPAGNSITVNLSNTVAGMAYVLRDATTKISYSNVYVGKTNGGTITIPTKAINATVTLEAVGTIVYTSSDGVVTSCQVTSSNSVTATVTATTNVYLSGTVFDDVNGANIDGTPVSSVTNASNVSTPLYAYVLNSANLPQGTAVGGNISGQAISTGASSTSIGTYNYNLTTLLGTTYGTYKVILSTSSTLPAASAAAASKPTGWVNIAEGLSGGGGDGTADGSYSFTYSSNSTATGGTTLTADFGIDGIPTAANSNVASQVNPGGTVSVIVPATNFSGTDPRDASSTGAVAYVHLSSFPSNATSITVTGGTVAGGKVSTITYYNGTLPAGCSSCDLWSSVSGTGLYVAAAANGNLSVINAVQADPVNGAVTVVVSYTTVDAAGIESTAGGAAAATISLPFSELSLSGTVYHDVNGLTDNSINGTAIGQVTNNASNVALYMNLVSVASSQVVAVTAVNTSTGAYSFGTADGLLSGSSYRLVLSSTQGTVSAAAPAATLASTTPGWVFTGEGSSATGDGSVDGLFATGALNVATTVNFGVNARPVAVTKAYVLGPNTNPAITHITTVSTANPASSYAASIALSGTASSGSVPGALTGSDVTGNPGTPLALTEQVAGVSVVIDPSQYSGLRHGSSYPDALMVQYSGVQLQPDGCVGADVGKSPCSYYNTGSKVWEIPAYELSKLQLLVRNGTSNFSFIYAWKDAAGTIGAPVNYAVSFEQPLPVHLLSFNGEKRNSVAALRWTAANEQSFRGYGVERSSDGRSFSPRGFVDGRGAASTQAYSYNDDLTALSGPYVYYRLRLEDISGAVSYSATVRLSPDGVAGADVQVLGNPVRTPSLRLQLQSNSAAKARIVVSDAAGRVVAERQQSIDAGTTVLGLELPAYLSNGTYTVLTVLDGERFTSQVLLDR